jgi:cysteinyl-tRNA synthetase
VTVQFRRQVRASARVKDFGAVLKACDKVRDELDSKLGVKVVDRADGWSSWTRASRHV